MLGEALGLGALARAGRAEECEAHGAAGVDREATGAPRAPARRGRGARDLVPRALRLASRDGASTVSVLPVSFCVSWSVAALSAKPTADFTARSTAWRTDDLACCAAALPLDGTACRPGTPRVARRMASSDVRPRRTWSAASSIIDATRARTASAPKSGSTRLRWRAHSPSTTPTSTPDPPTMAAACRARPGRRRTAGGLRT